MYCRLYLLGRKHHQEYVLVQVASGVVREVLQGMQPPMEAEGLCMELAAAHMTLLRIAEEADKQQHRQTGVLLSQLQVPLSQLP